MTEFDFNEEIEKMLDEQFPKGKCKERGNALVLYAIMTLKFEEFIRRREARLKNQIGIHWKWLKNRPQKEVAKFIVAIANAETGGLGE